MSVTWDEEIAARLVAPDRVPAGLAERSDGGEDEDPDVCDLGVSESLDETAREIYGGMAVAAYALLAALLTTALIVAWLLWRFVL